jgi:hypothetical protein
MEYSKSAKPRLSDVVERVVVDQVLLIAEMLSKASPRVIGMMLMPSTIYPSSFS